MKSFCYCSLTLRDQHRIFVIVNKTFSFFAGNILLKKDKTKILMPQRASGGRSVHYSANNKHNR